jgi:hypothetical protein
LISSDKANPPTTETGSAGYNGSFKTAVEAGEMTGFQNDAIRSHGGT